MSLDFKVKCMGKIHRVVLADNGQLCLVDHPGGVEERDSLRALKALGYDKDIRCLSIFEAWTNQDCKEEYEQKLPEQLKRLMHYRDGNKHSYRLARKHAKKHNRKFMDFSFQISFPPFDPHSVGSAQTNDREQAIRWLETALLDRGFRPSCYIARRDPKQGRYYDIASISTINNKNVNIVADAGNGSHCAIRVEEVTKRMPLICNEAVPVEVVADLATIGLFKHLLCTYFQLTHNRLLSNHYRDKAKRATELYRRGSKMRVELVSEEELPYISTEFRFEFNSTGHAAHFCSKLNELVSDFEKQDKIKAVKPR